LNIDEKLIPTLKILFFYQFSTNFLPKMQNALFYRY